MDEYYKILKKLNKKAIKNGDIPVSAIIIHNNQIISKAYNKKYKNNDPFSHAEILAIKKATKYLKTPNLMDCVMYVSLYPCNMCREVIKESKIKKVYYYTEKIKEINYKTSYIKKEDETSYFSRELSTFFKNKR
jgi:tRNA(adenine34) deaminase